MLAFPRNSGRQGFPVAKTSGFTLVELLTVIAIIMILAGIVVGVQRGVYSSQANAKARAEIQTLATALEQYKAAHGTYPRINNDAAEFFQHLIGEKYSKYTPPPTGSAPGVLGSWSNVATPGDARAFIDVSAMTTDASSQSDRVARRFRDPWGSDYVYVYATGVDTGDFGEHFFILYSQGPNKRTRNESRTAAAHGSQALYFTNDDTKDDIVYGLEYNP